MSICTIEIGWHDRQGQHGCVLDRVYLYAPIQKYEMLRNKLTMCELLSCEMNLNCAVNYVRFVDCIFILIVVCG